MKYNRVLRVLILAGMLAVPFCANSAGIPHVGYVYPAGGRQGTSFQVTVGGQHLEEVYSVHVMGTGVRTKIIQYIEPEWLRKKRAKAAAKKRVETGEMSAKKGAGTGEAPAKAGPIKKKKRNPKKQPNAQIDERVIIEITLSPKAATGDREIRLISPSGISNPLRFCIGKMEESREVEPNNRRQQATELSSLPAWVNGQVVPGDVDLFRLKAKKGRQLVFKTRARALIPYLADAVPGWFQAVLALYDSKGNEVAFADDYQFDPDPVLFFKVPKDGDYILEVRDAIHRGREDFVYRILIKEQPSYTNILPLVATPDDALPRTAESEPNNNVQNAQPVAVPHIIKGGIQRPGDWDVFSFEGKANQQIVAEVYARRLRSPLDAVLKLTDSRGNRLGMNDDHEDKAAGLVTHHADSYLSCNLPADGTYLVHLGDIQKMGGRDYAYQLRISPPRPDFQLRVVPSGITLPQGGTAPITVHVLRKDGFDGAIRLALRNAPEGVSISGVQVPADRDTVRLTISAADGVPLGCIALHMEGTASIKGKAVRHKAVPAEDMMQAFLNRHLVPAKELVAAIIEQERAALMPDIPPDETLKIPAGGSARLGIGISRHGSFRGGLRLVLDNPPQGLTIGKRGTFFRRKDRETTVAFHADDTQLETGFKGNLIVKGMIGKKRIACTAPAIPFEIVEK